MSLSDLTPGPGLAAHDGDFSLGRFLTEAGEPVPEPALRYRILGDPHRGRTAGWSLVFHALTGSASVDQWWGPLLEPGGALDPRVRPVLAVNLLGSCYGSSGPADGRPFPVLSTLDLARAHAPLLAHLGVERIAVATGGSLGGMVALQFGLVTPVPIDRLVVFAAPARTSAQAIGWNAAQRMTIEADPAWAGGRYLPGQGPRAGLAAARAIAMITYRSALEFEARFGRERTHTRDRYDVEHYLRRHGEKLVARFDARSYVCLMQAMDRHDLGSIELAGRRTARQVARIVGVGIDSDMLYRPAEVRSWTEAYARGGASVQYEEIRTPYGHDAFLIEWEQVNRILAGRPEVERTA